MSSARRRFGGLFRGVGAGHHGAQTRGGKIAAQRGLSSRRTADQHTGSWAVKLPSEEIFWSEEVFRIYGLDPDTTNLSHRMAFQLIHPDDRALVQEAFRRAVREKTT